MKAAMKEEDAAIPPLAGWYGPAGTEMKRMESVGVRVSWPWMDPKLWTHAHCASDQIQSYSHDRKVK
jgi:hypothetical protein